MGGKALKTVDTHRLSRKDYERVREQASSIVRDEIGDRPRIASIESYRTKEDFGDLDLLVETRGFAREGIERLANRFDSREHVVNHNVVSYDYQGFQVDLILTNPEVFESSQAYFAWNDLGNLMGRVAQATGLRFGWDGLVFEVMDKTEKVEEIVVTRNAPSAMEFLGYDSKRHSQGFDTIEEIYRFAASSRYFHPDLMQPGNAKSRMRQAKRQTYAGFMQWLQKSKNPGNSHQEVFRSHGRDESKDRAVWMGRLCEAFPSFKESLDRSWAEHAKLAVFKSQFNGDVISAMTGLKHQALGRFMDGFRLHVARDSGLTFRAWALEQTADSIAKSLLMHMQRSPEIDKKLQT